MVTREELKQYRDMMRELREKRALMLQAERAARESDRESDRRRAARLAKRYEEAAAIRAEQTERIAAEIEAIVKPNVRRVLIYRYIQGWSRAKTAVNMGVSEALVAKLTREGIDILAGKTE